VEFDIRSAQGVMVTTNTCVSVGWYGIGREAHLSVDPGDPGAGQVAPGGQISCVKQKRAGKSAERAVANGEKLLTAALSGQGLVSRLLNDKELADKVERFFERSSSMAPATPPPDATSDAAAPPAVDPAPKPRFRRAAPRKARRRSRLRASW